MIARATRFKGVVGTRRVGDLEFSMFTSLIVTLDKVEDTKVPDLKRAYIAITGDIRPIKDICTDKAVIAVKGAVQEEWYRFNDKQVPRSVRQNQEQRLKQAKECRPMSETIQQDQTPDSTSTPIVTKEKKRTIRTAIRALIAEGKDNAAVLAAVVAEFPDNKVAMKDVVWNRNKLAAAKAAETTESATDAAA